MSIRYLATSFSGSVIAAGELERRVHIWDLIAAKRRATFDTVFSFGGTRLAISSAGECCVAADYQAEGVAAYATSTGDKLWHRKQLKKAQTVRISLDGQRVYCCFDAQSCQVLSRETGKTIKTWPGVRDVWESPYEPVMLLEKRLLVLQTPEEKKVATIARETFAVLYVAFAPGLVCVSESTGPLRCLSTKTGDEIWRYAQKGEHFLELAFVEGANVFAGVCWPYERGGSHRLLRFAPESGEVSQVADLGACGDFAFCQRGSRLLSVNGTVFGSETGQKEFVLPFQDRGNGNT